MTRSPGYGRSSPRVAAGVAALCFLMPALSGAQETTTLAGIVRDSAGRPIGGVTVGIQGSEVQGHTNEAGGFRLTSVPVGRQMVGLRRMGYAPTYTQVTLRAGQIDSLVVTLNAAVVKLAGVVVEDEAMTRSKRMLPGFWERRSRGFGHFLTRDEIEDRHAREVTDLVRTMPGANVVNVNGRSTIRFKRSMGARDCPPVVWVDGMRLERAEASEFNPRDIEAIELYNGPATIPSQYGPRPGTYTCGAVIIWTRLPG